MSNKDDEEKFERDLNLMMNDVDSNRAMVVFNPYKKAKTGAGTQPKQDEQALMITPHKASRKNQKQPPAVTPEKIPRPLSKKSAQGRGMEAIIVTTDCFGGEEDPKDLAVVTLIRNRGIGALSLHAEEYRDSNTLNARLDRTVAATRRDDSEFAGIDNVVSTASHGYNDLCRETGIAESLRNIAVTKVIGLGGYFDNKTGQIRDNAYGDMVFSAVPFCVQRGQGMISPNFNKGLEPEFMEGEDGTQEFNPSFWKNQMTYYTQKNATGFTMPRNFLELSVKMASYLMTDETREEHESVLHTLRTEEMPLHLGGDWLKMTLYDKYAWVFVNMMNSPLTVAARKAGYRPIFLMKNAIKQYTGSMATMRHQFASCDKGARSSIVLVGFVKVEGKTVKKVIGLKAGRTFPTIRKEDATHAR
jgi:hypothetical protein